MENGVLPDLENQDYRVNEWLPFVMGRDSRCAPRKPSFRTLTVPVGLDAQKCDEVCLLLVEGVRP